MTTASTDEIRSQFPALNRIHNGRPVAYFDGPGGTQVPTRVVDAVSDYLLNHNANTGWAYPTSIETDDIIARAREAFADFFNASPNEIAFGQNMTSLTFQLARALGRSFQAGDEIIVTELDHHGNVDTWRSLESERGVKIRVVPMDPESGLLEIDRVEGFLNGRTKVVAIGAASNALGTMVNTKRVCQLAKEAGALSFVDAVHFAPHNLIDVKEFGCDFLACSAYKFYGPHVGVLFGRKELLDEIDFPKVRPAPDYSPDRVETGTQGHESIAGAAAAVDFLASLSDGDTLREKLRNTFDALTTRKNELTRLLWEGLSSIDGVRLYGPNHEYRRTPTISFTVEGINSKIIAKSLAEQGIFASHGNFYALTVVERLGLAETGGLLRLGCACYTNTEEVERVIEAMRDLRA
jgi:cysteine desulfurase family protein (TIGR01976 family)